MLYDLTVVQFSRMLTNLNAMLTAGDLYAKDKGFDMSVLLNSRLAPDQFPLGRQVQVACDTAKLCVARLVNQFDSAPKHADGDASLEELQTRISDVITYLSGFSREDFEGADNVTITRDRWDGKYLTGREFVVNNAIPNLYFHITTAYAILRHNGVALGKKDYLGPMPFKQ